MTEEKKISFSGQDNGVGNLIKRIQQDSKTLYTDLLKEAQKQTSSQKDQLKIIESQIKALERQNRLEKEQNQLMLERKRLSGTIGSGDYAIGISEIREQALVQRIHDSMLRDRLEGSKSSVFPEEEKSQSVAGQVFLGVMAAEITKALVGIFRQVQTSRNEFEMVSAIPGIGPGYARHLTAREEYFGASYRVRGLTGERSQAPSMSHIGMDLIESTRFEESLARAIGRSVTSMEVGGTAATAKAYSIDQQSLLQFGGLQRMGSSNLPAAKFLEDAIARGMDRSLTSDFVKNLTSLTTTMAQSGLKARDIDAAQMLLEFNKIGGPFSIRDPRSLGLISGIQGDIANPQSSFAQALSYATLREQNPAMSFLQLMIKRQEGGVSLLGGQLNALGKMGLSEEMQTFMTASTLTPSLRGNLAASQALVKGKGVFGSLYGQDVGAGFDMSFATTDKKAQELTSRIERGSAEVTDAFIEGMIPGMTTLALRFKDLMGISIESISQEFGKKMIDVLQSIDTHMPSLQSVGSMHNPSDLAKLKRGGVTPWDYFHKK